MSRFVTFEGIDKSGKSTQLKLLAQRLEQEKIPCLTSREPGGSPASEEIRKILLYGGDIFPETEALLFAAARAEHVRGVIKPALAAGKQVLVDRYIHSSLAYQVFGRGLPLETVMEINRAAMDGLWPERVFLLDADPEVSVKRKAAAGGEHDRMEDGGFAWLETLRKGYLALAEKDERIVVLDANQSVEYLQSAIWDIWMQDTQ